HVDVGGDQRRAVLGRGSENAERLAERDRRLVGHPGQLTAPDHADHRQTGASVHRAIILSGSVGGPPRRHGRRSHRTVNFSASASTSVTGWSQTKPRHTYAVDRPSILGRSANSGTPGWSAAP